MTHRIMSNPQSETPPNSGRISLNAHILIVAATAVITAAVLQAPPLQSANDRSRWATVWSLVERKTFQIDEIDAVGRWSTIDKVRYRTSETEPWHFYSSKPPLLSTIVAGLYAIERNTLGYGLFNDTALVTRLLLLIVHVRAGRRRVWIHSESVFDHTEQSHSGCCLCHVFDYGRRPNPAHAPRISSDFDADSASRRTTASIRLRSTWILYCADVLF